MMLLHDYTQGCYNTYKLYVNFCGKKQKDRDKDVDSEFEQY